MFLLNKSRLKVLTNFGFLYIHHMNGTPEMEHDLIFMARLVISCNLLAEIIILSETWSDTFMLLYSNLGWQIACRFSEFETWDGLKVTWNSLLFYINWLSARISRWLSLSLFRFSSFYWSIEILYWCRLFTHTTPLPQFCSNADQERHISWCSFSLF